MVSEALDDSRIPATTVLVAAVELIVLHSPAHGRSPFAVPGRGMARRPGTEREGAGTRG
jgi:hypothetical protein